MNCRVTDRPKLTEGDLTERCAHEGLYIFGRILVSSHQLRIRIRGAGYYSKIFVIDHIGLLNITWDGTYRSLSRFTAKRKVLFAADPSDPCDHLHLF